MDEQAAEWRAPMDVTGSDYYLLLALVSLASTQDDSKRAAHLCERGRQLAVRMSAAIEAKRGKQ